MARQQKLPFPDSQIHSTAPFQLGHIDVWEPYDFKTYNDFRYFLTLVDNFRRATWAHLLSDKRNVLSILKAFTSIVKIHIHSYVQTLRSDNAYELVAVMKLLPSLLTKGFCIKLPFLTLHSRMEL